MSNNRSQLQYHADNRTATWLELFFDLVFVVAVSKITHLLAHTHHGHLEEGIWWKFPLMFLPIWWIWMVHTSWNNLYDTDGKSSRAVSLFVMLQLVMLSTVMQTDWEAVYPVFNVSYFGLRLTFAILFLSQRRAHPGYERYATQRGIGMLIAALISLGSAAFPTPLRYWVFYLGLAIDILIPIILGLRGKVPAVHGEHLVERMGLLIIILMGESIISLSAGLGEVDWTPETTLAAFSGAVLIGAAWWIYFDSYHHLADEDGRLQDGLALAYPHFFTCLGLSVMANLIYHAIHPGLGRNEYQVMAIAGMVVFYLGKQIPYFAKFPMMRIYIWVNSLITLALCIVALFLPDNAAILIGLTVALLVYVILNYFTTIRKMRALDLEPTPAGK